MKSNLERAAIALLKRVEQEAERAVDLAGLADLANAAAKIAEVAQGKKETAGGTAVKVDSSILQKPKMQYDDKLHVIAKEITNILHKEQLNVREALQVLEQVRYGLGYSPII